MVKNMNRKSQITIDDLRQLASFVNEHDAELKCDWFGELFEQFNDLPGESVVVISTKRKVLK